AAFGRRRPNVGRLARRGDIEGLRKALRLREMSVDEQGVEWDLTVDIRASAASALEKFEAEGIAEDLAAALADPHPAVRGAVIARIGAGRNGDREAKATRILLRLGRGAVDHVHASLSDGKATPGMVTAAGLLGDARAVGSLIGAMNSPDPDVRASAATAAGK